MNWEQSVAAYQVVQKDSQSDSVARRRAFLKSVGLRKDTIRSHRLRPKDGLSEEAWWAMVKVAMTSQKNHGVRMLGKPVSKEKVNASSVRTSSE